MNIGLEYFMKKFGKKEPAVPEKSSEITKRLYERASYCFFCKSNLYILKSFSDEEAKAEEDRFERLKIEYDGPKDELTLFNYRTGKKIIHKGKIDKSVDIFPYGNVDMDCVKHAIIEMNKKKKVKMKELGIVYGIIIAGLIGNFNEELSIQDFTDFVGNFLSFGKNWKKGDKNSMIYEGIPKEERIEKLMAKCSTGDDLTKDEKKVASFANKFISCYTDIISQMQSNH